MSDNVLDGKKILVVDDEEDQRFFIATVLEDNGATVLQAADGDEALTLAKREKPDLITLDLGMPGKSGVEVFEEMRNNDALGSIPICVITGRPELRKLIYEMTGLSKPEGYLDKPISEEDLLSGLRRIIELKQRKEAKHKSNVVPLKN